MKDEKRYAWIVKETGKVASIRIGEPHLPNDRKKDMDIIEVGDEVESGMYRQPNGKYARKGEEAKVAKAKPVKAEKAPEPVDEPEDYVHPSLVRMPPKAKKGFAARKQK